MTTGAILFGLAIFVGVVFFVAQPYFSGPRPQPNTLLTRRQQLLLQKEVLLEQLQQIDFDQETGKIDPEVYERSRPRLIEQAALILKELETLTDPQTDDAIETAIARFRGNQAATTSPERLDAPSPVDDDPIEAAIARRRTAQPVARRQPAGATVGATANAAPALGRFCPGCGKPHDPGDQFCAFCGRKFS
ncbi:MAG: zinc ribbon domain-containing protein [Chloroflexi bacterium]|nr:zinc ribbon domain-containing protein [Chloroflexota bacterium]MBP8058294.1 zinc ribbon domain-containing protein [Chloroflexota bacterium]